MLQPTPVKTFPKQPYLHNALHLDCFVKIKGNYIDFVGDTVQAFRDAGLNYYNEAILITCVGSLPIRAGKQFSSGRKLGKTHQNILVFVKGSGKKAADRCGTVDVDESMFDGIEAVGGDEG